MNIRKLEEYEEFETVYPESVNEICKELEHLDSMTLERVKELAEFCYKEGYKDGFRFADWLQEKTR